MGMPKTLAETERRVRAVAKDMTEQVDGANVAAMRILLELYCGFFDAEVELELTEEMMDGGQND